MKIAKICFDCKLKKMKLCMGQEILTNKKTKVYCPYKIGLRNNKIIDREKIYIPYPKKKGNI